MLVLLGVTLLESPSSLNRAWIDKDPRLGRCIMKLNQPLRGEAHVLDTKLLDTIGFLAQQSLKHSSIRHNNSTNMLRLIYVGG